MKDMIPMSVFERLEREWRMIDPDRAPKAATPTVEQKLLPLRRVRISRFDEVLLTSKD